MDTPNRQTAFVAVAGFVAALVGGGVITLTAPEPEPPQKLTCEKCEVCPEAPAQLCVSVIKVLEPVEVAPKASALARKLAKLVGTVSGDDLALRCAGDACRVGWGKESASKKLDAKMKDLVGQISAELFNPSRLSSVGGFDCTLKSSKDVCQLYGSVLTRFEDLKINSKIGGYGPCPGDSP